MTIIRGAPTWPPEPPSARDAPAEPWRPSKTPHDPAILSCRGAPTWPPEPPSARDAPAEPWRPSGTRRRYDAVRGRDLQERRRRMDRDGRRVQGERQGPHRAGSAG